MVFGHIANTNAISPSGLVPRAGEEGFSMLELFLICAVLGILASVGVGQFGSLMDSFNRHSALQQFRVDVSRFKSEAQAKGARGVVKLLSGGTRYTFGLDYIPVNDPHAADEIKVNRELTYGLSLALSSPLIFNSRGEVITEDNVLTSVSFTLSKGGDTFCNGTIFAGGFVDYECS